MPQRNTLKEYAFDAYYHVYARGVNKQRIFLDAHDYAHFIALFERYLSGIKSQDRNGYTYPDFSDNVSLISYCLMRNHFHLFIHQKEIDPGIQKFMSGLMTSYSKYFNKKYKRVGSLFESRYKAKHILEDSYFMHISRYIHMNPYDWQNYDYSSLSHIFSEDKPIWLKPEVIIKEFKSKNEYFKFLEDYKDEKEMLQELKNELADT